MAVKGIFASHQNIVGARKGDFASGLLQTQPTGSAPLLALTSGMAARDAMDTVVTWFEENHLQGRINVTNNATTGVTLTVDDVSQVVEGSVFLIESTGEYVFVDSISGSDLTVSRGFGGSTNTSINGSVTPVPMQLIGTAFEEGSDRPAAIANVGFPRFNYVEIFRNSWDVTGTAGAIDYHTGNLVAKNKADAAVMHAEAIERACLFGIMAIGTRNGKPFRTMNGIANQLETNLASENSDTKWTDLRAFLQDVFSTNIKGQPNERIALCGNTVLSVIEDIARLDSTINIAPLQNDFGMDINKLVTPFGRVVLMTHPLMNESPLWTENMFVLHPAAIEMRYLRRTKMDNYDQEGRRAGVDADYGVITTECCITYKAEKTGGYYTGISTAAASDA